MHKRALVLFAHGARDPRWAEPFERLRQLIQAQSPDLPVVLGFLELMSPRLPELTAKLAQDGVTDVTIVPVFLGQGGHVLRDLPVILQGLRESYPQMMFRVATAVGEDASVQNAMAAYCLRTLSES